MLKRIFDILFSAIMLLISAFPMLLVAVIIRLTSRESVIYCSDRVGKNNKIFKMPKFRTMHIETPPVATHLMLNTDIYVTRLGGFLRKISFDELPQLWSILIGDMSVVGPRPALFNQDDLIALRTEVGVQELPVGLTGWAQINGRDGLPIIEKVKLDVEYMQKRSFWFDLKIIFLTFIKVLCRQGVSH